MRRLATGGTSDLLLAKAEGPLGFERTVVLKILLSEMLFDGKETHDELSRMFAREAYAYARLGHPAIVRLFDFFSLPVSRTVGSELPGPPSTLRPPRSVDESQLVMVLEYVDGPSLSRLRSLLKAIGREMDDHAAIWIASRFFAGLAAAHAATDESGAIAPVVHRDVNPSNVLVPWDGEVKLADFGVAKVMGQSGESVAGMIKGTYGYMAPEQVTGTKVGPAADVYAGAIILWELLTKRRAFSRGARSELEALRAMMEPELPSIDELRPDVDSTVRDALNRALRPKAADRTITAEEMVAVLHRAVPPVEGRDRLVALLGLVKNDSRVSTAPVSSSDPSMHARAARSDNIATAVAPPLPTPTPSSRRVVKRTTAPYGNPASRPALPAASPPSMPSARTTSRGGMGAVHRGSESTLASAGAVEPPREAPGRTQILPSSPPPALEPPPRRPSASHRLAQALPETVRNPGERITTATPVVAPDIRDSIHDLLDGPIAPNETGRFKRTEILGQIPGSPEPMQPRPAPPVEHALSVFPKTPKAFDSSASLDFGGMRGSQPDLAPRFNETMAMDERPVPPPPPLASATGTGPMPRYTPPGVTPVAPPVAATPSQSLLPAATSPSQPLLPVPPSTPSHRPAYVSQPPMGAPFASAPPSAAPPAKRSSNVLALAAAAVVALVTVTSGAVLYVRSRTPPPPISFETRADAPPVPTTAATPVVTATATAVTSAVPAPTPSPTVTAPEPVASAAPTEPAPIDPAASATEGTMKTTGALPGRRIFVDTAVVGQTPETVTVKCGEHVVRLGSSGKNQMVTVPCGGEITVADHY